MARYDDVFADMKAKLDAAMAVIANHPEIADEVRDAWTVTPDEVKVDDPTDEARANALAQVLRQAATVVGVPAGEEPESTEEA